MILIGNRTISKIGFEYYTLSETNDKGVLDKITFDFLRKAENKRLGRLYLLHKKHRLKIEIFNKVKKMEAAMYQLLYPVDL